MAVAMGERLEPRAVSTAGGPVVEPPAPRGSGATPLARPQFVVRPALVWRAAGPALIVLGLLGTVVRGPLLLVLVVAGAALLPLWVVHVECDGVSIRRRRLRGWDPPLPVSEIVALRLRRAPFALIAQWRRSFRFRHYSTVPLRLRLHTSRGVALDLTVVFWDGWHRLARFVRSQPDIEIDRRSQARLDRF
jgi:hypothetical protein